LVVDYLTSQIERDFRSLRSLQPLIWVVRAFILQKKRGDNMQKYADINNDSGVDSFEISSESITVFFKGTNRPYSYSYSLAGKHHVERMKE